MFFFFNDTATTEIYTLSLHDALPISRQLHRLLEEHEARLFLLQATQAPEHRVNLHQPDRETRGNGELLSAADLLLSLQQLPGIHLLLRQIEADRHLEPRVALTPPQPRQSLPGRRL